MDADAASRSECVPRGGPGDTVLLARHDHQGIFDAAGGRGAAPACGSQRGLQASRRRWPVYTEFKPRYPKAARRHPGAAVMSGQRGLLPATMEPPPAIEEEFQDGTTRSIFRNVPAVLAS